MENDDEELLKGGMLKELQIERQNWTSNLTIKKIALKMKNLKSETSFVTRSGLMTSSGLFRISGFVTIRA